VSVPAVRCVLLATPPENVDSVGYSVVRNPIRTVSGQR